MQIKNSLTNSVRPNATMIVYGEPGIGKTTFGSTAPNPILADCEGGAKYFGLRGIALDIVDIAKWSDFREFCVEVAKSKDYETIVVDPLSELMEKLKNEIVASKNAKYVQSSGDLTMAGWGKMKEDFKSAVRFLRSSGKNIILITHVEDTAVEGKIVKNPKIMTKIAEDLIGMVDIVGYMHGGKNAEGQDVRVVSVDAQSDVYKAKDRTGTLPFHLDPDFSLVLEKIDEAFKKSKLIVEAPKTKKPKIENVKSLDNLNDLFVEEEPVVEKPTQDMTAIKEQLAKKLSKIKKQ